MRFRNVYIAFCFLLVAVLWLGTDPDIGLLRDLPFGAGLIASLVFQSNSLLAIMLLYITRKGLFDYKVADFESLGHLSIKSSEGAGLYALALSLMTLSFAVVIGAALIAAKM
jgi:hypothetical protein